LAGEGEKAVGELRGAARALQSRFQRTYQRGRDCGIGVGKSPSNGVEIAQDHGEKIVEIVSDASRELPDRLRFLRLAKRGLGRFPFSGFILQLRD
jgi:hypothetical protein